MLWFFSRLFLIACLMFPSFLFAMAPAEVRTLEVADSTILVDWEDVEDAIGYYMYYGTKSGSGGTYETEGIELIEKSEFLIEDLLPETLYYIAVTSVDEFGTESSYSNEFSQLTLEAGAQAEAISFRIKEVEVIDETSLSFGFSTNLEDTPSAVREFIIENTSTSTEVSVDISDIDPTDPKKAIVVVSEPLSPATQYKVTVLDIRDSSGNTIESGVDAFISFMTPAVIGEEETTPTEPVEENPTTNPEEVDLESAGPENTSSGEVAPSNETQSNDGNAGVTMSNEDIANNTTVAAEGNDSLPQTGPEHVLLVLVALLLSGGVYLISHKKHS